MPSLYLSPSFFHKYDCASTLSFSYTTVRDYQSRQLWLTMHYESKSKRRRKKRDNRSTSKERDSKLEIPLHFFKECHKSFKKFQKLSKRLERKKIQVDRKKVKREKQKKVQKKSKKQTMILFNQFFFLILPTYINFITLSTSAF